ncbi:unnamed protein product, partial [Schistocephalus solidus]|uniref:Sodium-dependent transporter n=1 Tax=Schistocephalus solidus TaxID=70667 RepID=A0A183SAY3_SCHSO
MNREGYEFTYSGGLILSCLGCVLGTGNIWRFPRVLASASSDGGSLTFILTWTCFLFAWSIPLIITEYTMGRFTRGSPLISFYSAYFSVVVGWCFFYFCLACFQSVLPESPIESAATFTWFTHSLIILFMAFRLYTVCTFLATESFPNVIDSFDLKSTWYPLLMHTIGLVICGVCVFAGVQGIELANVCLVPIQLFIVIFTFGWSLTREYADVGIQFMFTPKWSTLADPKLYVEAACQNAFDTAAGMGLFSAYAAYFTRKTSAVRYGM